MSDPRYLSVFKVRNQRDDVAVNRHDGRQATQFLQVGDAGRWLVDSMTFGYVTTRCARGLR